MVIIPVRTHDTAGTGSGMPRYAKVDYRTRTCTTRFGNTAGFSVPILNPTNTFHHISWDMICKFIEEADVSHQILLVLTFELMEQHTG